MKTLVSAAALLLCLGGTSAWAKLPVAPQTDESKAKAAEAAAKTAHAGKVEAFKLCKSQDKAAAHYFRTSKKDPKAATATPACADPGAFVSPTAAAPAAPAPAAPAAPVAAKDGKKS
jgi:hypothetical protein